jgi:hypothetical protein
MRLAADEKLCILVEFCHADNEGWPNSDRDRRSFCSITKKATQKSDVHAALLSNHLTRSASMLFALGSNTDLY